eukprot:scaffold2161_cov57-Attheya_sp.AAC.2
MSPLVSNVMKVPSGVYLAPMVRGSELAFRMLARKHGVSQCYSPMIRAKDVLNAYNHWKDGTNVSTLNEEAKMCFYDTCSQDRPLVVQICGRCPEQIESATKALIEIYEHRGNPLDGIDLNLGCPQECADVGRFGAFLAEREPDVAIECIKAMRRAIDDTHIDSKSKPLLSAKIRLLDEDIATLKFAQKLQVSGCDLLTVHCRGRTDKHNGEARFDTGATLIKALDIPVIINGSISSSSDVERVVRETGAHGVMVARGFLENHRMLQKEGKEKERIDPAALAAEYLDFAEKYPPPSPLYIRRHFRWMFRGELQPDSSDKIDFKDWRPRLWTFLVRPYLETIDQFRQVVRLYATLNASTIPPSLAHLPEPSFKSIRNGKKRKAAALDESSDGVKN